MALALRGSLNAAVRNSRCLFGRMRYSSDESNQPSKSHRSEKSSDSNEKSNVKGLSEKVVAVPQGPVGPGASKDSDYKNPEYYCYSSFSFYDAEIELGKYRMDQPTNKKEDILSKYEKELQLN